MSTLWWWFKWITVGTPLNTYIPPLRDYLNLCLNLDVDLGNFYLMMTLGQHWQPFRLLSGPYAKKWTTPFGFRGQREVMKFSSEWIQEHLCLRWKPSQWLYLFVFDHIASLLQCAVNKLVQPGAGSPARLGVLHEKQEHVCNVKSNFENQFYSEIQV